MLQQPEAPNQFFWISNFTHHPYTLSSWLTSSCKSYSAYGPPKKITEVLWYVVHMLWKFWAYCISRCLHTSTRTSSTPFQHLPPMIEVIQYTSWCDFGPLGTPISLSHMFWRCIISFGAMVSVDGWIFALICWLVIESWILQHSHVSVDKTVFN